MTKIRADRADVLINERDTSQLRSTGASRSSYLPTSYWHLVGLSSFSRWMCRKSAGNEDHPPASFLTSVWQCQTARARPVYFLAGVSRCIWSPGNISGWNSSGRDMERPHISGYVLLSRISRIGGVSVLRGAYLPPYRSRTEVSVPFLLLLLLLLPARSSLSTSRSTSVISRELALSHCFPGRS